MNREELKKLTKEELIEILLAMTSKIAELTIEVTELKARLNQNSKNSSKPPSSDAYNKPKNHRKPSGKKPGAQYGHEGSGFKLAQEPDEYIAHNPKECIQCPKYMECQAEKEVNETRYEIDIDIATTTTAHQSMKVKCPETQEALTGNFPEYITGRIQYGANLKALAVSLNTYGTVSIDRTHEILSGVFGVPISTGTIASMVSDCAKKVEPTVNEIKEAILEEPVAGFDETGTRVNKKTFWAHVASTGCLTYIGISPKRGKRGMDSIGILPNYYGKAIHDCWASYFLYLDIVHGLCNAHLLRELIAVLENEKQAWAQELMDLLLEMKATKEALILEGQTEALPGLLEEFIFEYDEILAQALSENPVPEPDPMTKKKPKRGKAGALVDRLFLRKDQYLLFFTDFSVPFDNNQAERDFRMFKVKQKVSGCFRTLDGAIDFANVFSFISTARKKGISAFVAIRDVFLGQPFSVKANVQSE